MKNHCNQVKTRIFTLVLAAAALLSLASPALAVEPPEVMAEYALLSEAQSGEVLFERNADVQANPASLTKIMTALVVLEEADLSDVATVSSAALDTLDPQSSVAGLLRGEEVTVDNLLKMLLIASANDGANVLAEHVSGSVSNFVERMNERAAELGCDNTHFKNTHGLTEDGHLTTARDVYTITMEAMKHPKFMEYCNTASITIPASNKRDEQVYYTTNHLISNLKSPDYVYHYAQGIKTGSTAAAGLCLVSSAEKNGMYLVGVIMGSVREEESGRLMSFVDSKTLYEWGFSNFSTSTMLGKSTAVAEVHVSLSNETDFVTLVPSQEIKALLPNDFDKDEVELIKSITNPDGVDAPVTRGDILGTVTVRWQGRDYGTVDLVALSSVSLDKTLQFGREVGDFFGQRWVLYLIIALVGLILLYAVFVVTINSRRKKERHRNRHNRRR